MRYNGGSAAVRKTQAHAIGGRRNVLAGEPEPSTRDFEGRWAFSLLSLFSSAAPRRDRLSGYEHPRRETRGHRGRCHGRAITPSRTAPATARNLLDDSSAAVRERQAHLKALRTDRTRVEGAIQNVFDFIEQCRVSARDADFAARLAAQRTRRAHLEQEILLVERQLSGAERRITPGAVGRLGEVILGKLRSADNVMRQGYARRFIAKVAWSRLASSRSQDRSSRWNWPPAATPSRLHQRCPLLLGSGAAEKTRTSTGFRPQRPQRCASTSSATAARVRIAAGRAGGWQASAPSSGFRLWQWLLAGSLEPAAARADQQT